ncbi:AraC family transcriptional regulator [Hyalangium versicolor]|uniref:AraC family transcriptional regulator n=1 Tax=Hyalangium versicolor TaxID=2861190 RepID=UPI001CC92BE8|nr:AraC family transcriptional regulator [Hyalangium versicolor]
MPAGFDRQLVERIQAIPGGPGVDWMLFESGRRHVPWMKADAASRRIAQRVNITSVWAEGRTVEGPKHHNPGLELNWVEQGSMEMMFGGRWVEASAGACLLIPSTIEHTPRFRSAVFHQVRFSPQWIADAAAQLESAFPEAEEPHVFGSDQRITRLARCLAEQINLGLGTEDPELSALSDALTFCLVRGPPLSRERSPDASIRRALELMACSYSELLTVDDLARAAELPRFVFLRRFRDQVGTSPYRALTELRLERSAKLLRTSSATVLEVCLSCGFGDPSRFARMFRQRYGCTPLRFRREQQPTAHETPILRTNR